MCLFAYERSRPLSIRSCDCFQRETLQLHCFNTQWTHLFERWPFEVEVTNNEVHPFPPSLPSLPHSLPSLSHLHWDTRSELLDLEKARDSSSALWIPIQRERWILHKSSAMTLHTYRMALSEHEQNNKFLNQIDLIATVNCCNLTLYIYH